MTTGAPLKISDITDRVRWSDQVYGLGSREAPILTFARKDQSKLKSGKQPTTYTKTVLSKVDWKTDYIVQYIPISTPNPRQTELVGKLVSLVSIYPKEGPSRSFVDPEREVEWDIDRWPDAVMMREVFWFVDPPVLKNIIGERHRPDREWFRCDPSRFRDIALKTSGAI